MAAKMSNEKNTQYPTTEVTYTASDHDVGTVVIKYQSYFARLDEAIRLDPAPGTYAPGRWSNAGKRLHQDEEQTSVH